MRSSQQRGLKLRSIASALVITYISSQNLFDGLSDFLHQPCLKCLDNIMIVALRLVVHIILELPELIHTFSCAVDLTNRSGHRALEQSTKLCHHRLLSACLLWLWIWYHVNVHLATTICHTYI